MIAFLNEKNGKAALDERPFLCMICNYLFCCMILRLPDNDSLSVLDINALLWVCYTHTLQVVNRCICVARGICLSNTCDGGSV